MTNRALKVVVVDDRGKVDPGHVALAGLLGDLRDLVRDADAVDLRQIVAFCEQRHLGLFEIRRGDSETFGRELEASGRATPTTARRMYTVTGYSRHANEEGLSLEQEHRTLTIVRKGGKTATIALARRTIRAVDLAIGERANGERTL